MSGGTDFMYWDILGIEPTTDIKKIKRAYATAAKKNNPEEFPEKFREVHDAYEQAMKFASSKSSAFVVKEDIVENTDYIDVRELGITFEDLQNLYVYIPENKNSTEDFCFDEVGISSENTETKSSDDENLSVFVDKKVKSVNDIEDNFNFDDVDVIQNKYKKFDSYAQRHKFISSIVLKKMRNLAEDHDTQCSCYVWKTFLSDKDVVEVLSDVANHSVLDSILKRKRFTLQIANMFSYAIGGKCKVVYNPEFDIYYVDVTGKRKLYYYVNSIRKRKLNKIGWFAVVLLLALAIVLSPE